MLLKNVSLVGLLIAMVSIVTLVFRESLFAGDELGIAIQILSGLLMLWARLTFGRRSFHASALPTEGGLVTSGPYRFIRHPIYAAVLCFAWAGVLSHQAFVNVLLGAILTLGLIMRIVAEERLVRLRYPEYEQYAARTKRVIPFIL